MVCILKRVLFLGFLSYLVYLTVDFSAPELQTIRTHVDSSLNHIKTNKYYNDYVIPAKSQLEPFIVGVNDRYIQPSYTSLNRATVDKYQLYVSKHVDNVVDKIVQSPVYGKLRAYIPHVVRYYTLIEGKVKSANTLATKYTLIGINEAWIKSIELKDKIIEHYQITKPLAIDFYNNHAVPHSKKTYAKSLDFLVILKAHAVNYLKLVKSYACDVYKQLVVPFYQDKVVPLVQPTYDEYLKDHFNTASNQAIKYYNLLRVEKIFSLAKKYYGAAYEQIINYAQTKSLDESEKSTVATSDSPTEFEEETQVPRAAVTPTASASQDGATATETHQAEGTPEETPEKEIPDKASETDAPAAEDEPVYEEVVDYDGNEGDLEVTITSTIVRTATQIVEEGATSASSTEDSLEPKVDKNGEVILTLADEITAWREFIENTVGNIFKNYDKSIVALEKEKVSEAQPGITELLQSLSMNATSDYHYVNRVIYDINSTTTTLENGEVVEVDREGKLIDHKISRQEFRDLLADKREVLKVLADQVNDHLKETVKEVEAELETERRLINDIFEEFAEVAINEFGKKMMYSTFSNSFKKINQEGLEEDDENFSDWREYVKAKNYLIKKREELIQKEPELAIVNGLLKDVAFTLRTLEQESGNGFAILRAKANLAFQFREARERKEEEEALKTKEYGVVQDGAVKEAKVNTPAKSFASLSSSEMSSQETEVVKTTQPVVKLSKDVSSSHTAKVDEPVRSFAQVEEVKTESAEKKDLIDAVEEAAGTEPEPAEPVGGVQQPIVDAVYESMDKPDSVESEATGVATSEKDDQEDDQEEEQEAEEEGDEEEEEGEEEEEEEIFEHVPDSEDTEVEEDIVEHKPDSAE